MSEPILKTRAEHLEDSVRRVVAYTDKITYFGENSAALALLNAAATAAEGGDRLYAALVNRVVLANAKGDALVTAAASRGTAQGPGTRSTVMAVVRPVTVAVTAVAVVSGSEDDVTLADGSVWEVGDVVRLRYTDPDTATTYTDYRTVASKPSTNVLRVATLTDATAAEYQDAIDDDIEVLAIFRVTVPVESTIDSLSGAQFLTKAAVITSDANPVMGGESTVLALADKVLCEATEIGEGGNIDRLTLTDFNPSIRGVLGVDNPERGSGGAPVEVASDLKQRAVEGPSALTQDTLAWLLAVAKRGNSDVLRLIKVTSPYIATVACKVLKRNGGAFSTEELTTLETYISAYGRSFLNVTLSNVTMTSVEVEATITLVAGYTLEQVWRAAANRLAAYCDFRTWEWGADVDEAALLSIVRTTEGVATLETSTFLPASDVTVATDSLPRFTRLSLRNGLTGATINATLATSF